MSTVFANLTENNPTGSARQLSIQVDFDHGNWSTQNPNHLPILGTSGKIASASIAGSAITNLYAADGTTVAITLNLFGNTVAAGDTGLGTLLAGNDDPDDAFSLTWTVQSTV